MALDVNLKDSSSGTPAEIDAAGNVFTVQPGYDATGTSRGGGPAAGPAMFSENDPGTVTGTRYVASPETDDDFRLRVAVDTLLDTETFNYAAQNTGKHQYVNSSITAAWGTGGLVTNSTSSTGAGSLRIHTYRNFPILGTVQLYVEAAVAFTNQPVTNNEIEWGLLLLNSAASYVVLDGVSFRLTSAGLQGVVNNNSVETATPVFDFTYATNEVHQYIIAIHEREVEFWIDDVLHGSIPTPVANGQPFASAALPFALRQNNSASTGAAISANFRDYNVTVGGSQIADPYGTIGNRAFGSYQGLSGGTMGSLASYVNSTTPAAAAGSNTAALVTGLGGQAHLTAQVTGTTDNIVLSYQVPAATTAIQGKTLRLSGVKISAANLGAAVATTPTTLAWSLAFGHTAVSLATAEAAAAKAPRRIALGMQTWPVGAAVGSMPTNGDIYFKFDNPVYVNPGEFVALAAKFIVGTATASQSIYVHGTLDYGWE